MTRAPPPKTGQAFHRTPDSLHAIEQIIESPVVVATVSVRHRRHGVGGAADHPASFSPPFEAVRASVALIASRCSRPSTPSASSGFAARAARFVETRRRSRPCGRGPGSECARCGTDSTDAILE